MCDLRCAKCEVPGSRTLRRSHIAHRTCSDLPFLVRRRLAAEPAVLVKLQLLGVRLLVLRRRVVLALAFAAREGNVLLHRLGSLSLAIGRGQAPPLRGYSRISVMVPAPTVRPPS